MLSWCVAITIFGIVCFDLECVFKKTLNLRLFWFVTTKETKNLKCIPKACPQYWLSPTTILWVQYFQKKTACQLHLLRILAYKRNAQINEFQKFGFRFDRINQFSCPLGWWILRFEICFWIVANYANSLYFTSYYSRSSPHDHSSKRPALVTTTFVKSRLNCDLNFVTKGSRKRLLR